MKTNNLPAGVTHDEMIAMCNNFLKAWHENQRGDFERVWSPLNYDEYAPKTMKERRDWICLDQGNEHTRSGVMMLRKSDLHVFVIKGYGVPNLKKDCGHILDVTTRFLLATVDARCLHYNSSSPLP